MKKILICVALACCLTAAAHSNDNDTIVVMKVIFKSLIAIM